MERLRRSFFEGETIEVAERLLGCILVRRTGGEELSGSIVETEAYGGSRDPASHAYRGKTGRNASMFGEPGHAYVYLTRGTLYCLNVVTGPPGTAEAVLLRAIEPLGGIGRMMANRKTDDPFNIGSGPAKLTQAMRIDRKLDGEDFVTSERLFLKRGSPPRSVSRSVRIGVTKASDREWRYFDADSRYVSRRRRIHNYR